MIYSPSSRVRFWEHEGHKWKTLQLTAVKKEMILVGGGSKSLLWRQMLADAYGMRVLKTTVDQQAAALGAAALAAVGTGAWPDFKRIEELHEIVDLHDPDPSASRAYAALMPLFRESSRFMSAYGDAIASLI